MPRLADDVLLDETREEPVEATEVGCSSNGDEDHQCGESDRLRARRPTDVLQFRLYVFEILNESRHRFW
jgi:hypothetical protein